MSSNPKSKRRTRRPKKTVSQGHIWPWYLAAVIVVGGIMIYDNRQQLKAWSGKTEQSQIARQEQRRKPEVSVKSTVGAKPVSFAKPAQILPRVPVPDNRVEESASIRAALPGKFFYCSPSRADNCVIDGNTFIFKGEKIRIADIEAPKARQARCDAERLLAHDAKERLRVLLSAGDFKLAAWADENGDPARGASRRVIRNGQSLGEQMAVEGVVQRRDGKRRPWCPQG
ncbi:thermonuclease family protein [Rhizobium sp. 32-5/1]|uniref:thermonuclease family protein n=1 Tax=Rhizobium sp. 32-5/1 TaxID=3019602 RepID=UPI00240E855A|nr:thermonuclease family protein [Rhizobium sp. 32-5/1]WEZ83465.1 thermonuclease family protein [Rhizobium sp. 32-5/1]